jgi:hypothetical protein
MGIPIIVYGKSGTGKSRSLKEFGENDVFLVNVLGKPLPFRKAFKYTANTDNLNAIMGGLSKMGEQGVKVAVIDDFGYIMTNMFMRGHGSGDQFKLYNQIGDAIWTTINFIQSKAVAPDAVVYLIMHEDVNDDGTNKLRTIGKLLDQKVCIEGMATVVLHACIKGERYVFETQNNGASIAKSPEGMFDALEIPNDLKAVDDAVRKYWNINREA